MEKKTDAQDKSAVRFLKGYSVGDLDEAHRKTGISFPCNDGRISRITVDRRRRVSNGDY